MIEADSWDDKNSLRAEIKLTRMSLLREQGIYMLSRIIYWISYKGETDVHNNPDNKCKENIG